MMELAFRIMARSLFSTELPEAELRILSDNISTLQEFIIREIRQPFLEPWFRLSGQVRRHEALARQSDEILLRFIRQRQQSGETKNDLLQMLLDARYEDSSLGIYATQPIFCHYSNSTEHLPRSVT